MGWITTHLGTLFGIGATGVLLYLLLGHRLVKYIILRAKGIHQTDNELIEGQSQLIVLRTTERNAAREHCSELEANNAQLARDLKEETRKVLLREQINAEDTTYIRALTARLRRARIDYSDINSEFNRTE